MTRARDSRLLLCAALAAFSLLSSNPAGAVDFHIGNQSLRLDLTESMFLAAHLDDGNIDPTDKNYGELLNRLNAQLAWKRFLLSVRFDSGAWFHSPEPGFHSPYVSPPGFDPPVDCPAAAAGETRCVIQKNDSRLHNRFVSPSTVVTRGGLPFGSSAFYLEKIALSYTGRAFEATLGDFYVNLGRGLVLSVRKLDELGTDTTLTGAKVVYHDKGFAAVALAGWSNVQNLDQATAQYIPESNDFISALHADYRLFDRVLVGAHAVFGKPGCPEGLSCSDHAFDFAYVLRPGVMIDAPRLTRWLGVYAEYARRQDRQLAKDAIGNALYAAVNVYAGRTSLLVEFKDYDNYQPWHSSYDPLSNLQYMVPPTLERVITQINNNSDIIAGRLRADVRVNRSLLFFWSAQVGRSHPSPVTTNTLVDFYAGAEARWDEGRSHFFPLVGLRSERQNELHPEIPVYPGVEERLYALEWDAAQVLSRRFALESAGLVWLRRKGEPGGDPAQTDEWREGNVYLSLKWSPRFVATAGYEFTTQRTERANQHNFFNGSLLWNITPATSIGLFVGGNRPGLKCISGVCRVFPAFQGARLEFVLRL